jgi:hypothetical protein
LHSGGNTLILSRPGKQSFFVDYNIMMRRENIFRDFKHDVGNKTYLAHIDDRLSASTSEAIVVYVEWCYATYAYEAEQLALIGEKWAYAKFQVTGKVLDVVAAATAAEDFDDDASAKALVSVIVDHIKTGSIFGTEQSDCSVKACLERLGEIVDIVEERLELSCDDGEPECLRRQLGELGSKLALAAFKEGCMDRWLPFIRRGCGPARDTIISDVMSAFGFESLDGERDIFSLIETLQ